MKRALIISISLALVAGLILLCFCLITRDEPTSDNNVEPELIITKPDSIESRLMFFGDVFWGRYVNEWAMTSDLKEAYPFSGLYTLGRDNYQAWIGSLNCPITDNQVSAADQEATLTFNCTPNYLTEAQKWFNIFSLANSYTDNQGGIIGFNQTREYLDEYGIQYFGHYDKTVTDEICEIITVSAKAWLGDDEYSSLTDTNYPIREYYIPIAMCGYHDTFALPTQDQLDEISKYTDKFVTLVYAIQGSEYNTTADGLQRQYFHAMIDEGADAVIGKGAHVVQDTESYKGKPIIYSMGNFIYDQQASPDVRHGIGVDVDIYLEYNNNLEKWQQVAAACSQFKDDCLIRVSEFNLEKPEYTIDYNIIATDNSDKLAKKGSNELQSQMLVRTNWQNTLSGLTDN